MNTSLLETTDNMYDIKKSRTKSTKFLKATPSLKLENIFPEEFREEAALALTLDFFLTTLFFLLAIKSIRNVYL
jgi:hypothetical protein